MSLSGEQAELINEYDSEQDNNSIYEDCWNYLTDGQKHFLTSLSDKESWYSAIVSYNDNDNWDLLQERIESYDKCISYDDFHYLGKDMTFVNNDIDKINQLNYLKNSIIDRFPNIHYHGIAKRIFIDYRINSISFKIAKNILVDINNMI